jgi:hypothetical protein
LGRPGVDGIIFKIVLTEIGCGLEITWFRIGSNAGK